MKKNIFKLLIFIIICSSCEKSNKIDINTVFRYNEHKNINSLDPIFAKDIANIWAVNQLYNGLVEMDKNLNVVPSIASIWYFLREITYKNIMEMYDTANKMAQGAALMTNTSYESEVLGAAWPRHFNKILAEHMYENIKKVGLPKWSEDDQKLARAVQKEIGIESINGLATELPPLRKPLPYNVSGGSDDIGDVSWKVPTVVLRFPSNIPDVTFHHWSASIAAATPIAHKGANAGAKVVAMTALDFLTKPEKLIEAKNYFNDVQTKEDFYRPLISETDPPPFYLNTDKMEKYRDKMQKFYFDETKYDTYLEQLGVEYPEIDKDE